MKHAKITPYHNYGGGYIYLAVNDLRGLPNQITVKGKLLLKKNEFHVSLLAIKYVLPMINSDKEVVSEEQLVQDFVEFQKHTDLSLFSSSDVFRLVSKDKRASMIMVVDVPNIEKLFAYLRQKYKTDIPTQPTHITLYTLQPERGIGILSSQELEEFSEPTNISMKELANQWASTAV